MKLRQHGPSHINKSPVLPLGYTILLRGVRTGILMLNPLFTKKIIQALVLKLGAVVTSYGQYGETMLALDHIGEVDDGLLSLTLQLEEINPSIS